MNTMLFQRVQRGARRRNRRLGWILALLIVLYTSGVIAFIVAY